MKLKQEFDCEGFLFHRKYKKTKTKTSTADVKTIERVLDKKRMQSLRRVQNTEETCERREGR